MFGFRDYTMIYELSENSEVDIGRIFIPQSYLSQHPEIPDEGLARQSLQNTEKSGTNKNPKHQKKLLDMIDSIAGERCERSFFETMKQFYDEQNLQVFGFSNLKVFQMVKGGKEGEAEKDFLIIIQSHGLIISVECKDTIDHNVAQKALEQIQGLKDWLEKQDSDILKHFKFIGMIYAFNLKDGFEPCEDCSDYIIIGESEIQPKLAKLGENRKPACPKQFRELIKNLAFIYQANPNLPVTSSIVKATVDQIGKAGTLENIKLLAFWTPGQMGALSMMDCKKVQLKASFGVGKSLILTDRAIQLAKSKQKVKFYIRTSDYFIGK